jgi:extradiol dioxygenase family protein
MNVFHLAYTVTDLDSARRFYGELLECKEGRSTDTWVDFNFFGHQLVAHLVTVKENDSSTNPVDGEDIPA